jgi:hypothetical protein
MGGSIGAGHPPQHRWIRLILLAFQAMCTMTSCLLEMPGDQTWTCGTGVPVDAGCRKYCTAVATSHQRRAAAGK